MMLMREMATDRLVGVWPAGGPDRRQDVRWAVRSRQRRAAHCPVTTTGASEATSRPSK